MIRSLLMIVCVVFIGCATKQSLPIPPRVKALSKGAKVETRRDSFLLSWEDCAEQPPGVSYRIYETTNFVQWFFYSETTNRSILIPCTQPAAFYGVAAAANGMESVKAGADCPPVISP